MKITELAELCISKGVTADMLITVTLKGENEHELLKEYIELCQSIRQSFLTQSELNRALELRLLKKVNGKYIVSVGFSELFGNKETWPDEFWSVYPPTSKINGKVVSLLGVDWTQYNILYKKAVTTQAQHQLLLQSVEYGKSINFAFPKITNFLLQKTWTVIVPPPTETTEENDV